MANGATKITQAQKDALAELVRYHRHERGLVEVPVELLNSLLVAYVVT